MLLCVLLHAQVINPRIFKLVKSVKMMPVEMADADLPSISACNDLLRAPTRKRKPRREHGFRRVRTLWESDRTGAVTLDGIGVSSLESDGEDSCDSMGHPTPPTYTNHKLTAPGAPKLSLTADQQMVLASHTTPAPLTYIESRGITGNSFLLRKTQVRPSAGKNPWDRLSEEMVLDVFRWLSKQLLVRCARVCKRWNRLALDETLWRRLDLSSKTLRPGVTGRILSRGVAVMRLSKTEVQTPLYDDSVLNQPRICKVQYLDLSMALVSVQGLEQLLQHCHLLRKLSIENCELSDNVCKYIGQNRHLEVLNLCMCSGITENGLVPLCNNLQRLDALNVGWTNMARGAIVYLVICLPSGLTKLNLSGCRETLHDEDVQQLCRSCPHLKELDLSDATMLSGLAVEHIADSLQGLEYTALSRCYHVTPSSLPRLARIPSLLAVDVFGVLRDAALAHLRDALVNIELNKFPFSSIARPTTGLRRTSIWGVRVRDPAV